MLMKVRMQINNAGIIGSILDPEKLAEAVERDQNIVSILDTTPFYRNTILNKFDAAYKRKY